MALTEEGIIDVEGMLSRWVRLPSGARAHGAIPWCAGIPRLLSRLPAFADAAGVSKNRPELPALVEQV